MKVYSSREEIQSWFVVEIAVGIVIKIVMRENKCDFEMILV